MYHISGYFHTCIWVEHMPYRPDHVQTTNKLQLKVNYRLKANFRIKFWAGSAKQMGDLPKFYPSFLVDDSPSTAIQLYVIWPALINLKVLTIGCWCVLTIGRVISGIILANPQSGNPFTVYICVWHCKKYFMCMVNIRLMTLFLCFSRSKGACHIWLDLPSFVGQKLNGYTYLCST